MLRSDGRGNESLRKITVKKGYLKYALGSCLIECGHTRIICTALLEDKAPTFLKGTGKGWITAEYGMIPASCKTRLPREAARGKLGGRTVEIQRLIGRALRAVVDLSQLGERTIWIDADVIQADGGTRTLSITGGFIALGEAINKLLKEGIITGNSNPIKDYVAAVSVGIVDEKPMLDLDYDEDSRAEVDMNIVMTGQGKLVEVQGTAEGKPFSKKSHDLLLNLAQKGIKELIKIQKKYVKLIPER